MYQEIKEKLKGSLFRWLLGGSVSWLVGWSQRWADTSLFRSLFWASKLFLSRRNIFDISGYCSIFLKEFFYLNFALDELVRLVLIFI